MSFCIISVLVFDVFLFDYLFYFHLFVFFFGYSALRVGVMVNDLLFCVCGAKTSLLSTE
jgi:hypothetical protein